MFIANDKILRRIILMSLAGTRGGPVRLKIILLLENKPSNINEISKKLGLDYKTVEHHIRVLEKSGLISSSDKKYDNAYAFRRALEDRLNNLSKKEGKPPALWDSDGAALKNGE